MRWAIKRAAAPCKALSTPSSAAKTPTAARGNRGVYRGRVLGQRQAHQLCHRGAGGVRRAHAGTAPRRPDVVHLEDGITLEQLPFIDPRTGAPSAKEDFKPAEGRLSYTRSPSEARDRICRALGIGRAASPLGKKFNEVFQMGTSMDEIPNFREFLYQYILPPAGAGLGSLAG